MTYEERLLEWGESEIGPKAEPLRGAAPRGVLVCEDVLETGLNRYSLASDVRISEVSVAGVPIQEFFVANVDPCSLLGGIWMGSRDINLDAARYTDLLGEHGSIAVDLDDIWYCCLLDFAVGTSASGYILAQSVHRPESTARARILGWSLSKDFDRPEHELHFGAQSPGLVKRRIARQIKRLRWAGQLSPTSGSGYKPGAVIGDRPPDGVPAFPGGLLDIVKAKIRVPLDDVATHRAYHAQIAAYLRQRRRADPQHIPWRIRFAHWWAGEQHHPEAHGRLDGARIPA